MSISVPDILLVEDNPSDAELLMLAHRVNQAACVIHVVEDGAEAIDFLLGDDPDSPDGRRPLPRLVLLDLHAPRIDGFQVLQRLRADEHTRRLPVVIFSASDAESDVRESHRLGASGYLVKPPEFTDLCKALAQLEREWLQGGSSP